MHEAFTGSPAIGRGYAFSDCAHVTVLQSTKAEVGAGRDEVTALFAQCGIVILLRRQGRLTQSLKLPTSWNPRLGKFGPSPGEVMRGRAVNLPRGQGRDLAS